MEGDAKDKLVSLGKLMTASQKSCSELYECSSEGNKKKKPYPSEVFFFNALCDRKIGTFSIAELFIAESNSSSN